MSASSPGLILFGHGARDPRWREPFERLLAAVATRHPAPVSLAFLEHMQPDLQAACLDVVARGARSIVVVPLFLGTGGHIRRDLPLLLQSAARGCGVLVRGVGPAGEDSAVLDALAVYCLGAAKADAAQSL